MFVVVCFFLRRLIVEGVKRLGCGVRRLGFKFIFKLYIIIIFNFFIFFFKIYCFYISEINLYVVFRNIGNFFYVNNIFKICSIY